MPAQATTPSTFTLLFSSSRHHVENSRSRQSANDTHHYSPTNMKENTEVHVVENNITVQQGNGSAQE